MSLYPYPDGSVRTAVASEDFTITGCFAQQVALYGGREGVQDGSGGVTYAELDRWSNQIAQTLIAHGCGSAGVPIGLLAEAGAAYVSGIIGTLKAGCAYLPLDPYQPAARQRAILADSGAVVLLSDAAHSAHARELASDRVEVVDLERIVGYCAKDAPGIAFSPQAPAYILYTSGSTGMPKGVLLNHRSVVHNALVEIQDLGFCHTDRSALILSTAHGLSASIVFHTLLSGGALFPFVLRRHGLRALAAWLQEQRISILKTTPSVARRLMDVLRPGESFPHLRYVWLGGEPLYRSEVAALWPRLDGKCRIIVSLSATETKEICRLIIDRDTRIDRDVVPVGRAVRGKRVRIWDEAGRDVTSGEIGDLWVQSRYLAEGYWRDAELTRARFMSVPGDAGERLYRTGDLVRESADGCIELCGRRDLQVKVRGFRVQLEEAEAALRRVAGVKDAAVVHETFGMDGRLSGYIVADRSCVDATEIRKELAEIVPDYLIPTRLSVVEALPLGASGKVDRQALSPQDEPQPADNESPSTRTEEILLKLASGVVDGGSIGLNDDFFSAGGDSLAAAVLLARVEEIYQADLSDGAFFKERTLAWLARRLDAARADLTMTRERKDRLLMPLVSHASAPPVYMVPGGGGGEIDLFIGYADLVAELGRDRPVFGFRAVSPDGRLMAGSSVEAMAEAFVCELQATQRHGPYALLGSCYGGLLAVEMARRLRQHGERVFLVLVDTHPRRRLRRTFRRGRMLWRGLAGRTHMALGRLFDNWKSTDGLRGWRRGVSYITGVKLAASLLVVGGTPYVHPDRAAARRIGAAREAYRQHLLGFRLRPYRGSIAVVLSEEYMQYGAAAAWRRYAWGDLKVLGTPGDHNSSIHAYAPITSRLILECFDELENSVR